MVPQLRSPGLLRHYDIVVVFKCIILFDSVIEQRGQKGSVRLAENTTSVAKEEKEKDRAVQEVFHIEHQRLEFTASHCRKQ